MKRIITVMITLCMLLTLLPMSTHAETSDTRNLLTDTGINWTTVDKDNRGASFVLQSGTLTAPNEGANDAAYMSDIVLQKGTHYYIEAKATITAGMAWGIIFSESGANNPFDNWFCINIDTEQMNNRLFFINCASGHGTSYGDPSIGFPQANDGKEHTLGLEILESGAMKMYLDGGLHTELPGADFEGATLGIMTCRGSISCSSFTLKKGAPENVKAYGIPRDLLFSQTTDLLDPGVLTHSTHENFYKFENGGMRTDGNGGGDRAIMSDIRIEKGEHVYIEATAKILDDGAFGLMFTTKSPTEPFANWFCLNADLWAGVHKTRLFDVNSTYEVNAPREAYYYDEEIVRNRDITLGLEITPDGTFYITYNGMTYAEKSIPKWNGAWVGLMTWNSSVEFSNARISVVSGVKPPIPENWETTLSGKFDIMALDGKTVLATADYDSANGTFKVNGQSYALRGTLEDNNAVILDSENKIIGSLSKGTSDINITLGKLEGILTKHADTPVVPPVTGDMAMFIALAGILALGAAAASGKRRKIRQ